MTKTCSIEGCSRKSKSLGWCIAHHHRYLRHGDPLGGGTAWGAPMQWLRDHLNHIGDECLIWPFARRTSGYGEIYADGKMINAHRRMCELRHGPPPTPKHEAAHSCGKGHLGCVNGSHLRWATPAQNQADRLIHGTHKRGERQWMAKLTEADVLAIRAMRGIPQWKIANRYGVDQSHISDIVHRKTWAWLD